MPLFIRVTSIAIFLGVVAAIVVAVATGQDLGYDPQVVR